MSQSTENNDFVTGFMSVLFLDFIIFFLGLFYLDIFQTILDSHQSAVVLGLFIGIVQYAYVVPIIIWQLIIGNKKFVRGFLIGSLLVLSISLMILILLIKWLEGFPF